MIDLTSEQIAAAKANDLSAVTAVIEATEERVAQIARKIAPQGGDDFEELLQIGRITVWEALGRFQGTSVAQFFTYMNKTVTTALSDARRADKRQGVSANASRDFESALARCGGDPFEAERWLTSAAAGRAKMSPEMAYAARLSWQGSLSLDMPVEHRKDNSTSGRKVLADTIETPSTYGVPDDLVTEKDRDSARRNAIREAVHRTLGKMAPQGRAVLCGTYGIDGPTPYFGTENNAEFAAYLGIKSVPPIRSMAQNRFRVLYLAGEADAA